MCFKTFFVSIDTLSKREHSFHYYKSSLHNLVNFIPIQNYGNCFVLFQNCVIWFALMVQNDVNFFEHSSFSTSNCMVGRAITDQDEFW